MDISLEDAGTLAPGAVTATVDALAKLIESGNPLFKDGKLWTPHRPARPEKSEGGIAIRMVSEYQPAGDQPTAIADLVGGLESGERSQVLLGVTGSGKTFTMAKVIEETQRPAVILAPNKTLGPALQRVQELLPRQCGGIFRFLLRLLSAGSLCAALRHLYREGKLHQRADRPHAPLGDALSAGARRRHHRRLGLLHLRYRLGRDLYGHDLPDGGGRPARPAPAARRPRGPAIQAPRDGFPARLLPGARRYDRDLPRPPGGCRLAHLHVRRRDRRHHRIRSADRPQDRRPEIG